MQAKVMLRRPDGSTAQIAITADATASVADLANALVVSDPDGGQRPPSGQGLTLKVEQAAFEPGATSRLLDPARSLIDSGLRSGSTVSIAAAAKTPPRRRRGRAVAILRILSGPDGGSEFPLTAGNSTIGTGPGSDVVLTDPAVKDTHAALTVGETIDVFNVAGPTGVLLDGQPIQRSSVGANDVLQLGNTTMVVIATAPAGQTQSDTLALEFTRSPRVVTRFEDHEFSAPAPPQRPEPVPLPVISLVAPLIMGLVLFAVSRSLLAIVFIALSPLLMIGMYLDNRRQANNKYRKDVERFGNALQGLAKTITDTQQVERAVRLSEAPSLKQVVETVHRLGPLLWTHRPESSAFLTVRLGLADLPSRCHVRLTNTEAADATHVAQLNELQLRFADISEVPLVADLRECGAMGICGPRAVVEGVARGIVMQLAGLHSPAEMTITAFGSAQSRASWEWLEWLPHTGSPHSPITGNHLTDSLNGGRLLLARLEELIEQRLSLGSSADRFRFTEIGNGNNHDPRAPSVLPAVIVLVDDTSPVDRSRLIQLAEQGAAVGIHVVWIAAQVNSLPAACRAFLIVEGNSRGATAGQVRRGQHSFPVSYDSIDIAEARQVALLLAPVVDIGSVTKDDTDLPRSVSFLEMAGVRLACDPGVIAQQWISNDVGHTRLGAMQPTAKRMPGLSALVGAAGSDQMYLDLREHGPHALVGGTTGAGKSELLQTWITAMAAAHSPERVNFLLVDYKGGTAFADCVELPHTVGLVTDLSPYLVRRALVSLGAEIRRREHLLNTKRAKDLVSLEQTGDPDAPPALVIIVDEFAALASEVPEFVDGVIDVAQRGRSLGLHLVLATQRPAGIIKDNLRANTNLRIALRLNDVDDSLDIVGDPMAAFFPPEIPGRAVAKTGPGRLTTFQSAYVGGWTSDQPEQAPIEISEFVFGRHRPWQSPAVARHSSRPSGPTDIGRLVAQIRTAATQLQLPLPRRPWLPPLESAYNLESLTMQSVSHAIVVGTCDIPTQQAQPLCEFSPDESGNIAIIGTGGAGKSTALRTLAISAALNEADGPVHVYVFDFASGSVKVLEALPHVAAVVAGDDEERIGRVLHRLTGVLEQRSRAFSGVNASTITEYRAATGIDEPRILLLVDGIGPFRDQYEHISTTSYFSMFSQLASDGRMLGIHVCITADRPSSIPSSLGSTMQRRLVLRLASDDDYVLAGVPAGILSSNSPPGRGVIDGSEVQIGVFGGDSNVAVQARAIDGLAQRLRAVGFRTPEPVERLSDHIELEALAATTAAGGVVIGVADETLQPIGVAPGGILMVTGPPGSGRSTALATLAQAVRRSRTQTTIVHAAPGTSNIAGLDVWSDTATGQDAVIALVDRLIHHPGELMIVIEGVGDFGNTEAENQLARLVKSVADRAFIVGESEVSAWGQAWLLAQPFKASRRGLLLWPSGVEADSLLSTSLGVIRSKDQPPGRGALIERGKGVWLQVAQPIV